MAHIVEVRHDGLWWWSHILLVAIFLVAALAGCSGSDHAAVHLGAPPDLDKGNAIAPSATSVAVLVRGVRFVPPEWFPLGDHAPLAAALDEYVLDAQAALGGWLPRPGSATALPLTIVWIEPQGTGYWLETLRTAWLPWPRGPSGLPVRRQFAPLLAHILILDRRRELYGSSAGAWSQQESDARLRGRALPVILQTHFPGLYEP